MDLKLKEHFARLGPIRDVDLVSSGSPAVFVLRRPETQVLPKTVDGLNALARRGLSMLRAKRAIEALVADGRVFVELPKVEDAVVLIADLNRAGIAAAQVETTETVDIRGLRERLRVSREQFALRYGLEVETLRNWENGRQELDAAARSYLRAIARNPEQVEQAYAPTPTLAS